MTERHVRHPESLGDLIFQTVDKIDPYCAVIQDKRLLSREITVGGSFECEKYDVMITSQWLQSTLAKRILLGGRKIPAARVLITLIDHPNRANKKTYQIYQYNPVTEEVSVHKYMDFDEDNKKVLAQDIVPEVIQANMEEARLGLTKPSGEDLKRLRKALSEVQSNINSGLYG